MAEKASDLIRGRKIKPTPTSQSRKENEVLPP
jgi:hypothetical protein